MSCLKKNLLIVVKYTYHKIHHVSYLKAYSSVTVHIFIVLYNHRCRTFSSPQKETPIATKQWLTQIPTPSPGLPVCFPSPWICLVYILDVSRFRRCVPYKWNHTIIWPFVSGFFHNVFEVHPHCSMCQNSFPSHCWTICHILGSPSSSTAKESACNAGNPGLISVLGSSPGEGEPTSVFMGFRGGSDSKESACNAGVLGFFLGWKDPLEEGMATHPSILAWRIPMDRGAWRAAVPGVAKSQTWLSTVHAMFCLSICLWWTFGLFSPLG